MQPRSVAFMCFFFVAFVLRSYFRCLLVPFPHHLFCAAATACPCADMYEQQPVNDQIPWMEGLKEYQGLLGQFSGCIVSSRSASMRVEEIENVTRHGEGGGEKEGRGGGGEGGEGRRGRGGVEGDEKMSLSQHTHTHSLSLSVSLCLSLSVSLCLCLSLSS